MQSHGTVSRKLILAAVAVFLALSVADLLLTQRLVEFNPGEVVENNPIAGSILASHGWIGMAAFKFSLMTVIGGLVLCIFKRRPRSAEMVTIFGCGAQAAIVLTSFFHLYSQESTAPIDGFMSTGTVHDPGFLPPGGLSVLVMTSVQSELQLSNEQIAELETLVAVRHQLRRDSLEAGLPACRGTVYKLEILERDFMDCLTPTQLQRLRQLAWQYRGELAFTENDVGQALRLSCDQFDEINGILEKARASAALKRELAAVLTPVQRGKWQTMLGAPFDFDPQVAPTFQASSPDDEDVMP